MTRSPNPTRGATEQTLSAKHMASPVGTLRLVASDSALVAVLWPGEADGRVRMYDQPRAVSAHPIIDEAITQLGEYFGGTRRSFALPLDPRGTDFQRMVWWSLADIPYGETSTYGKQAANLGRPRAVRAVGAANGRNPLSIVLPCHRVIGSDGKLTGFAGGVETKRWLLAHESGHRDYSL